MIKKNIAVIFWLLIASSSLKAQATDTTCWNDAESVEEALTKQDSCNLHLDINEYTKDINSTLVIDNSLSKCTNIVILGIGTTRYLKINADFSKLTRLEEFGVGGKMRKDVVNKSIAKCTSLQRVGIGFHDSSDYVFPKFLNYLGDSVRLIIEYHFENINTDNLFKNLIPFLKKTEVKRIRIATLLDIKLNSRRDELLKDKNFRKITKIVHRKKIQLYLFGLILN